MPLSRYVSLGMAHMPLLSWNRLSARHNQDKYWIYLDNEKCVIVKYGLHGTQQPQRCSQTMRRIICVLFKTLFLRYVKAFNSSTPTTPPTHTHTPTPDSTHPPALEKMGDIVEDDICKCIFLNENYKIPIRIPLKFVPKSPTDNKAALVQVMAWRRTCDKPLLNQCWPTSLTHMCGTRGRWVDVRDQ